jgi:hypothetical protein
VAELLTQTELEKFAKKTLTDFTQRLKKTKTELSRIKKQRNANTVYN